MGTRARSSTPDLFSSPPLAHSRPPESSESSPAIVHAPPSANRSRHVLPADLENAVRHLNDKELDQLLSAVITEQKRRGKKLLARNPRTRRVEVPAAVPLAQGKLNAVRAAFKAGVTHQQLLDCLEFHSPMFARRWRLTSQNVESTVRWNDPREVSPRSSKRPKTDFPN
jgi:hypothetical protein